MTAMYDSFEDMANWLWKLKESFPCYKTSLENFYFQTVGAAVITHSGGTPGQVCLKVSKYIQPLASYIGQSQ